MGAAAQFNITVRGKGGHAAMPHTTVDPVVAGAAVVTALQVGLALLYHSLFLSTLQTGGIETCHSACLYGKIPTASVGCF